MNVDRDAVVAFILLVVCTLLPMLVGSAIGGTPGVVIGGAILAVEVWLLHRLL